MHTILSTKILSPSQKSLLLNAGLAIVDYDAIQISFKNEIHVQQNVQFAIFSSKNAVKALLARGIKPKKSFCVGAKTAQVLKENKIEVLETAPSAQALAKKIMAHYPDKEFYFFCGNKRRDELPEILTKNNILINEIEVYKTRLNFKHYRQIFDAVLFFSPSGVQSFTKKNKLAHTTAFCIGETTGQEAKKHCKNIIIANQQSIENVIVQAVNYFKE